MTLCLTCNEPIASKNGKSTRCHPCWVTELRSRDRRMENSPTWKGGKIKRGGYIYLKTKNGKYIAEHRLIVEKHLKRLLKPKEKVHHLNGNPSDNRIENLEVCENQSEHVKKFHPNLYKYRS